MTRLSPKDLPALTALAARTTTVRELAPLLRALGADLITAALAATE